MRTTKRLVVVGVCVAAAAAIAVSVLKLSAGRLPSRYEDAGLRPRISPDYIDCVIPPNIAPLNFVVQEPGSSYRVKVHGAQGQPIIVTSSSGSIVIPLGKWRELLADNRGSEVSFDVYVRSDTGRWQRFETINNTVAQEEIDPYVVYRLIGPLHNAWNRMGIYQRNMEAFDESPILRNEQLPPYELNKYKVAACLNCHTFVNGDPGRISIHIRAEEGPAMLLGRNGETSSVDARSKFNPSPGSYTSWHPNGEVAAFSANKLLLLHRVSGEGREVFDANSDLGLFSLNTNLVSSTRRISDPDYLETFPAWSPDGKYLYFSRAHRDWPADAKGRDMPDLETIRYDLMRIAYDHGTGRWGELETVLSAGDLHRTLLQPRVSPDGKFLLFTTASYGNFPIWLDDSDLHMLNLATGEHWPLFANSEQSDTWHSWSTNSRWILFTSKRSHGRLFARLHISYIDADGKSHKPVILPQKDPTFYDSYVQTYNAPELATGRVLLGQRDFDRLIASSPKGEKVSAISGASPRLEGADQPGNMDAPDQP